MFVHQRLNDYFKIISKVITLLLSGYYHVVRMISKYHVAQNSTRQNFDELIVGFKGEAIAGKRLLGKP